MAMASSSEVEKRVCFSRRSPVVTTFFQKGSRIDGFDIPGTRDAEKLITVYCLLAWSSRMMSMSSLVPMAMPWLLNVPSVPLFRPCVTAIEWPRSVKEHREYFLPFSRNLKVQFPKWTRSNWRPHFALTWTAGELILLYKDIFYWQSRIFSTLQNSNDVAS